MEGLESKKFRSVIRKVVWMPVSAMMAIMIVMLAVCWISFLNIEQQLVESNINSLKISLVQMDTIFTAIDDEYRAYIISSKTHKSLSGLEPGTELAEYLVLDASLKDWLAAHVSLDSAVASAYGFYEHLGWFTIKNRGSSNNGVQSYINAHFRDEGSGTNGWRIIEVDNAFYIWHYRHLNEFYSGCWLNVSILEQRWDFKSDNMMGIVYIVDEHNNNTLEDPILNAYIKEEGRNVLKVNADGYKLNNYLVENSESSLSLGILIPRNVIVSNIPAINKATFIIAVLSIFIIPALIYWLRKKIAIPVTAIDDAMQRVGEGEVEYRIELAEKKAYDEFDRLMVRFNLMMDDLNELEYNLYMAEMREQQAQLRYISQQIRPHFILNALNIIYTYKESEFPLVKKMVLYLSNYFRYIVNLNVDFVELEKEMRHVENYLNIQKERYPDGFEFFVEWESQVSYCLIPPLIIQTFVENCIKYAMKNNEKLFIFVLAEKKEDCLKLMIADTGNGFNESTMEKIRQFIKKRTYDPDLGVGIQNAIERLDILYEGKIEVVVRNAVSGGAVIEFYLPMNSSLSKEDC